MASEEFINNYVKQRSLSWVFKRFVAERSIQLYFALAIVCSTLLFSNFYASGFNLEVMLGELGIWKLLGAMAFGWGLYLIQEYIAHVWVFHMPAPANPKWYKYLYRLHMGHHDMPKRLDILITPFWFTLPVLMLNMFGFYAVTSSIDITLAATLGLVLGYIEFEWFHLLVHSPYSCKTRWLKFIQKRHMAHHYITEKRWFTVTPLGSLLDDLFLTGGRVETATPSNNPKNGELSKDDPRLIYARKYYNLSSSTPDSDANLTVK
ncbi:MULTISPECIES: sterol desaturase family protein [unclassified Pseudoalteromonas]|uniref:sterol desaturase family protein n=1 Tax=unclassified Pseudoalteromonas TaxID=194690 RepID=UPI003014BCA0